MQKWAALPALVLLGLVHVPAVELAPDARALDEAIALGQSRIDADRERFHAAYRVVVGQAPLDIVEVLTPFRRVALAVEARHRTGERLFSHRLAREVLEGREDVVELRVELTFHPHHTFVGVPGYDVLVVRPDGAVVRPKTLDRVPRHGPRVDGPLLPVPAVPDPRGPALPMTGGTLVAGFDAAALNQPVPPLVVLADGDEVLARVTIDFRTLR
jgi:hypothetical protein